MRSITFRAAAPPNTLTKVEVDVVTVAFLVTMAASIITVIVSALARKNGVFGMTSETVAQIGVWAGVAMILMRSIIAAFQNKGVSANIGVLTRVEGYVSTYTGAALAAVAWITSAVASVAGYGSALGISNTEMAKLGAFLAGATVVGHGIQLAAQNWGFAASKTAAAKK